MSGLKLLLALAAALPLSACIDSPNPNSVARMDTLSASCPGSPHMRTMNNLPMRCGPQVAAPYTMR